MPKNTIFASSTNSKELQHALPFRAPFWARNAHIQTIASSLFAPVSSIAAKRREVNTIDGDFLEIDVAEVDAPKRVSILIHGLEGSSERYYIKNLMHTLTLCETTVFAVNLRGCGYKMNARPRFYHSGATEDLLPVLAEVKTAYPNLPVICVGFSLGGNLLVKYLGENGSLSRIDAAVAVSPPFDLHAGSLKLQNGFNQVYQQYFMKSLIKKLEAKRQAFPDIPAFTGTTLFDFDDKITAPLHGFKNALHYYETCSSKHFFGEVKCPLLVIHSKNDPICPIEYAPFPVISQSRNIQMILATGGGHVGFWEQRKNWLNELICRWCINKI